MDAKRETQKPIQKIKSNWGVLLSLAGAFGYGLTIFANEVPGQARSVSALLAAIGAVQWFRQSNKKDTREAVDQSLTVESMLAGLGIKERLNALETHQDEKHSENKKAHAALIEALRIYQTESDRLHAEHISVTDSLTAGLQAVGVVVTELRPGFELPPIVERQRGSAA